MPNPEDLIHKLTVADTAAQIVLQGQLNSLRAVVTLLAQESGHPHIAELCKPDAFQALTKKMLKKQLTAIGDQRPDIAREVFLRLKNAHAAPDDPDSVFS